MTTAASIEPMSLGSAGAGLSLQSSVAAGNGLAILFFMKGGSGIAHVSTETDLRMRWEKELAAQTADGSSQEIPELSGSGIDTRDIEALREAGSGKSAGLPDVHSSQNGPVDADSGGYRRLVPARESLLSLAAPSISTGPVIHAPGVQVMASHASRSGPAGVDRIARNGTQADAATRNASTTSGVRRPSTSSSKEVMTTAVVAELAAGTGPVHGQDNGSAANPQQQQIPPLASTSTGTPVSSDVLTMTAADRVGYSAIAGDQFQVHPSFLREKRDASPDGEARVYKVIQPAEPSHTPNAVATVAGMVADDSDGLISRSPAAGVGGRLNFAQTRNAPQAATPTEVLTASINQTVATIATKTSPVDSLPKAVAPAEAALAKQEAPSAVVPHGSVETAKDRSTSGSAFASGSFEAPASALPVRSRLDSGMEIGRSLETSASHPSAALKSNSSDGLSRDSVTADAQAASVAQSLLHANPQVDQFASAVAIHASASSVGMMQGGPRSRAVAQADKSATTIVSTSVGRGSQASGWPEGIPEAGGMPVSLVSPPIHPANTLAIRNGSDPGTNPFQKIDATDGVSANKVGAADNADLAHTSFSRGSSLAVGYQDPALGYVELHAHGAGAGVHASLLADSTESGSVLSGHLASLADWMHERHTAVTSLTVLSPNPAGDAKTATGSGAEGGNNSFAGGSGTLSESGTSQQNLTSQATSFPWNAGANSMHDGKANSEIKEPLAMVLTGSAGSGFFAVA